MFARAVGMTMVLAIVFGAVGRDALGGKKEKDAVKEAKEKGVKEKGKEKYEVPKDAIAGTLKAVDVKGNTFTIAVEKAKDRTFMVTKTTEFYGPRGGDRGTGPEGLKDDCMEKGYEIHVLASKDGKSALEVHLPVRKSEKDDKKK